jgi:hypothetical protein
MPAWNQQPQPQAAYQWQRGQQLLQVNVEAHERDLRATNNPTFGATFSLPLKAPDATQSKEFLGNIQ